MPIKDKYDAVVVGSGPNGLAAAITLAEKGLSVVLFESKHTIGGGMRSAELTLPGFVHDICSAVHPLGVSSPFFSKLPIEVQWIQPLAPLAHPLDNQAVLLERSIEETMAYLGKDAEAYKKLMKPFVKNWEILAPDILAPLHFPKNFSKLLQFALVGIRSAKGLTNSKFQGQEAKALFAGLAGHSILPLDKLMTSGYALVLGVLGHAVGWPIVQGGTQKFADALANYFISLGGEIVTDANIKDLEQLPRYQNIFFDLTPRQLLQIVKDKFPSNYRKSLERYRYGPGVFKMDWALSAPIPWKDKECLRAGTVHIGGTFDEIAFSERQVWEGKNPEKPFIILAQPSLFDSTRAPKGKHTAWGYCHVPNGSTFDMTARIENQIERFAPGFKECILARNTLSPDQLEQYNPNYVGGDINGGIQDIAQFVTRPVARLVPYSTPVKGVYICSSSTPPGGGVHGLCGYFAAQASLNI